MAGGVGGGEVCFVLLCFALLFFVSSGWVFVLSCAVGVVFIHSALALLCCKELILISLRGVYAWCSTTCRVLLERRRHVSPPGQHQEEGRR